ncbi:MAG: hypothetical protein LEGION0403_FIIPPAGN_00375 [Legionella sp.]|uniref:hypothetical protein n=1 Tax=Legionella sp. TaxID=459 RepID=UPI003D11B01B
MKAQAPEKLKDLFVFLMDIMGWDAGQINTALDVFASNSISDSSVTNFIGSQGGAKRNFDH